MSPTTDARAARCPKPGCNALKARPCLDWDCPQQTMPYKEHAAAIATLITENDQLRKELYALRADRDAVRAKALEDAAKVAEGTRLMECKELLRDERWADRHDDEGNVIGQVLEGATYRLNPGRMIASRIRALSTQEPTHD